MIHQLTRFHDAINAAKHVDESKAGQHCKKIGYASLEQERFFLET